MGERVVVVGLAVTGAAVAREMMAEGKAVVAVDDRPDDSVRRRAADLGIELVEAPSPEELARLAQDAEVVVVSPGVPARHPVFALGDRVALVSEVELAGRMARAPMVAVTGTNGKTTVTTLVAAMLDASGVRALAAGNIGLPLVEAARRDVDVLVAEVSSFQLQLTSTFRPRVAVWLNLAEDHLDWHPTMQHYVEAKARVWANQAGDDLAVANADDPVVWRAAARAPARVAGSSTKTGAAPRPARGDGPQALFHVEEGELRTPQGDTIAAVAELARALPHDLANALAAVAAALGAGATLEGCRRALLSFRGLPHRVEPVGEAGGVRFYDDSKATTPSAVLAALAGFESVVLIAGGRNKGLDLGALRSGAGPVRAVVAIGEAAAEVEAAFAGLAPVSRAGSMDQAVETARAAARPGDAVVLSPGCASFDWYRSYAERGNDFRRAVAELLKEDTRGDG